MPISINFDEIRPQLTPGTLVLTPNSRTQKALTSGSMASLTPGEVVRAPEIMSFSQWQTHLWQELSFFQSLPRIIGNLELKVWLKAQIVADEHWQLTNALGVAEKILDAYRNLYLWNKKLADLEPLETPENRYFVKWMKLLENFCKDTSLIPGFATLSVLIEHQALLHEQLPKKILLVGFNQLSPVETSFIQTCQSQGIVVQEYFPKITPQQVVRLEGDDIRQEIAIAASNAQVLARLNPGHSIAIVINQLTDHLSLAHQVFSEYFQPQESIPWHPLEKTQYNVSAGQPLAESSIVDAAIKILNLKSSGFDLQTLAFLKNSPFINWGENGEHIKRFLHQQSLLALPMYSCRYLTRAIELEPQPQLLEKLVLSIQELENRSNYARPISAWTDLWKSILRRWGWLQSRELDEFEQNIQQEFYSTLSECSSLGLVYPKSTDIQAGEYLLQALRLKSFQIPSDRTNVHILGVLEATGLEFDELFLVGFNRDNWPQKAKFNPFLPVSFQQKYDMPGSSAEREFDYAKSITESLLTSANHIWITQSKLADDSVPPESPLFASYPLLQETLLQESLQQAPLQQAPLQQDLLQQNLLQQNLLQQKPLQQDAFEQEPLSQVSISQYLNPKLKIDTCYRWRLDERITLSSGQISGGTYLLSRYASCPFKAMSSFQLNLKGVQQSQKGVEPKTKGAWLHLAMELFWNELKTQQQLLNLSDPEVEQLVDDVVLKAKLEFDSILNASAPPEIIELETQKLKSQILSWLEIEKTRKPFKVETEVKKHLSLGDLDFTFRIDRVDENQDGELEIIDYKTGQTDFKKWLGKRPEEAQMPAYVIACEDSKVGSLSYAKIKTGDISRNGVWFNSQDPANYQFVEETSERTKDRTKQLRANQDLIEHDKSLAEQWRENLEGIANKVLAGDMQVSPKNEIESCRYCEFSDFCRISEAQPKRPDGKVTSTHTVKLLSEGTKQ